MRIVRSFILGAALLVALTPAVASAQGKKIHINLGGGPTFSGGDLGNVFSTGLGPSVGITYDIKPGIGIQFEYGYRWFTAEDWADARLGKFSGNHKVHQLDFNFVANLTHAEAPVRVYLVAGPGAYERSVEITKYVGNGVICGWYVCGTYPIDQVIGSRGGWDFGFNFGGGVGFRMGDEAEFFIESRYHYVVGPDTSALEPPPAPLPAGSTPAGGSTTGHYTPLTFGFRF